MSDSLADFQRKTAAMLEAANLRYDQIAKGFLSRIAFKLVTTTPGPNNQLAGTFYEATGRLRGAWALGDAPISVTTRFEGGPYDDAGLGEATAERLGAEVMAGELLPFYFFNNDVAYNYLVEYGSHRMEGRFHVDRTALAQHQALSEALSAAEAA